MDKKSRYLRSLGAATLAVAGCKAPVVSTSKGDQGGAASAPSSQVFHFSLADYISSQPPLSALAPYVSADKSYLGLGTPEKVQIKTNVNIDSNKLSAGPSLKIEFWLDGVVFNQQIGGSAGRGQAVDLWAQASLNPVGVQATLRFLGQDRLKGSLQSAWDDTLTRDLTDGGIPYDVPNLGLTCNATLGGELGLHAEVGFHADQSLVLSVVPTMSLTAQITGTITLLDFASANAVGKVSILDAQMATSAGLGYYPELEMLANTVAIDSSRIKSLQGSIRLGANAKADLNGLLPPGVDRTLWLPAPVDFTDGVLTYAWVHDLWKPDPVYVKEFPTYSDVSGTFITPPATADECRERVAKFNVKVAAINALIDNEEAYLQLPATKAADIGAATEIKALEALKKKYAAILTGAQTSCNAPLGLAAAADEVP